MTIKKLTHHNWSTWKARFDNIIVAKGYKDIMNKEWVAANGETKDFQIMSAWAMDRAYSVVSEDLHLVITATTGGIYSVIQALAKACGEKSIIQLCDNLNELLDAPYIPGKLLSKHISIFQKNYMSLKLALLANPDFMTVSTGMAAAFFLLQSLSQDDSLTSLVQSLYNLKDLNFESVFDQLSIEDGRRTSINIEKYDCFVSKQSMFLPSLFTSSRGFSSGHGLFRGGKSSRGSLCGIVPTCSAPNSEDSMSKQFARMFKQQMDQYMKDQAHNVEENEGEDAHEVDDTRGDFVDDPDDTGFMISDELNLNSSPNSPSSITLIFDSGASKTTLCDFHLLLDPKPISKAMNTSNYVLAVSDPDPDLDYHILLGHPSDEYLSRFFEVIRSQTY